LSTKSLNAASSASVSGTVAVVAGAESPPDEHPANAARQTEIATERYVYRHARTDTPEILVR
jgi:hypothetical protein